MSIYNEKERLELLLKGLSNPVNREKATKIAKDYLNRDNLSEETKAWFNQLLETIKLLNDKNISFDDIVE